MKLENPKLSSTTLTHRSYGGGGPGTVRLLAWFHWLFIVLLVAAFALVLATLLAPSLQLPGGPNGPEVALLLLATASTIVAQERRLPLQNVLLATVVIAIMGGLAHALGAITGIPFGPFMFTLKLGPKLFNTLPWAMPLIWIVVLLNSRGVARLVLRPWRKIRTYGYWLIALTAVLTMLFAIALDPFASRIKHYWFWTPTLVSITWQGATPVDFLGWLTVSLLILVFVTPALINKQLSRKSSPDFHPLCIWLGSVLVFGIACATQGLWPAAIVDGIIGAAATILAVRGARW